MTDFVKLPYRYITGLTKQQQHEIWRDFEAIAQSFPTTPGSVDAVIDPALPASVPALHKYVNLSELAAHEVWAAGSTFNVGVIARANHVITEGTAVDISARGHMTFTGTGDGNVSAGALWDWRPVTMVNGQVLTFKGISLSPTTLLTSPSSGGGFFNYIDCTIGANMGTASNQGMRAVNSTIQVAVLCTQSGTTATLLDCDWSGGQVITGGSSVNTGTLIMYGGRLRGTFLGYCGQTVIVGVDVTGTNVTISASTAYLLTGGQGGTLTVTTSQDVFAHGSWGTVFMTNPGPTPTFTPQYSFSGDCNFLDVTGPITVFASVLGYFGNGKAFVRGEGIRADLGFGGTGTPKLSLVGCTNSFVSIALSSTGSSGQAYAIDAASHNNVVVVAGSFGASITAGTNLGANNNVINEFGSSAAAAGGTGPNLLMGELAAIQSGVQSFPPVAAGSSVPSGPAGGSLAGTFPNPIFAGRDSSVDELNKDLLPAALLGVHGPQGVQVYNHQVESALAQKSDISGTAPYFTVTGIAGKKVSATAPNDGDLMFYTTGFSVGWVSSSADNVSKSNKDFSKDFMLMGG